MADKELKNFLWIMIFMTVIVGAILFAYCELGGKIGNMKNDVWLIVSLIVGCLRFLSAGISVIFSNDGINEQKTSRHNVTAYIIAPTGDDEKKTLSVSKSDGTEIFTDETLQNVDTVVIGSEFVDLPIGIVKKINEKERKIIIQAKEKKK